MSDFLFTKKPATTAEFDEYVKKLTASYEVKLADQKERIFSLVDENKKILNELAVFKGKDEQISKALMMAISKAKEIEDAAKIRYEMEIERLKFFHSKWISYYSDIKNKLPSDEKTISAEAFLAEMDRILGFNSAIFKKSDDDARQQFESENKRLNIKNADSKPDEMSVKNDLKMSIAATDDTPSGLDMNEVLSPKNLPELEELIKHMGILNK